MTSDEFIEALLSAPDGQARSALMDEQLEFLHIGTVYALKERADRLERDDPHQTISIGLVAEELANAWKTMKPAPWRCGRKPMVTITLTNSNLPRVVMNVRQNFL